MVASKHKCVRKKSSNSGDALQTDGGKLAMELRIAEQYLPQLGRIAQKSSTVVLPANLTDLGSVVAMARGMFKPGNEAE